MRVVDGRSPGSGRLDSAAFVPTAFEPHAVQVAVVDDHMLIGRLVVGLLERAGYSAAHVCADADERIWDAVARLSPELVLLDFDLGPLQSSREILQRAVDAGMIVAGFTASDDRFEHAAFLEMGAAVIIGKGCGPTDLVAVVELALAGEELMAAHDRHAALVRLRKHRSESRRATALFDLLTSREEETLRLIAEGHGAAEIADVWEVALATVRSHIRAVLTKLGVSSQLQAAAMARDSGWYESMVARSSSSILTMPNVLKTVTIATRSGSRR